jgi:C1A family cysteine protease
LLERHKGETNEEERTVPVDVAQLRRTLSEREDANWNAASTIVSQLSREQMKLRLGAVPQEGLSLQAIVERAEQQEADMAAAEAVAAPAVYDLRNVNGRNFITPIKDQGGCGSCVAFGTCAAIEGTLRVQQGDPNLRVDLSEAHLFYCHARNEGRNCGNGWWTDRALTACRDTGVADEACYPYTAGDQACNVCGDWQNRVTKIRGFRSLTSAPAQMKEWISTKGPLTACFAVYEDFFAYRSGVYRHVSGNQVGGHCVSIVGYDDGQGCWICKNSWGAGWGESGFFRIAYGQVGIDTWAVHGVDGVTVGPWGGWASQGGVLTTEPVVAQNADGRLEVFVRGTDNAMWHKWQTAPSNGWSGWASRGGVLTSVPALGRNHDGRLEAFVRGTDNACWHMWQTAPNGNWSGWAFLGGALAGRAAVAQNADGRLEVFVRGAPDNALKHRWQTAPSNGWS